MTRGHIVSQARAILSGVPVGGFAAITLPEKQPQRRMVYQQISGVAGSLWGVGCFQLETRYDPTRVVVWRLCEQFPERERGLPVLMDRKFRQALRESAVEALMEYMSP